MYGDLIDEKLLGSGMDYEELPEVITIFILNYDPFDEGAMYYEAGTTIKTHPHIEYNDGIRRIFLYAKGELAKGAGEGEKKLKNLLKYINQSTEENVTDEAIRRLDEIVKDIKAKKDVGVRYVKSWEREQELREDGREEGRAEERANTEAERNRADTAEARANEAEFRGTEAETRASDAEVELAKYREKYGVLV